jgi:hypothetical protein
MSTAAEFLANLEQRCQRNRDDWEALSELTGLTVAELEADLTAPDPHTTEDITSEAVQ